MNILYGGTKSEMERLLADASKIAGVEFSIDNYNDVIEAIHVMQGEMGITGTTFEEAEKTISGSISMMKASWDNLLTGFLDENADIGALIDEFVKSVGTVAQNLAPRLGVAFGRIFIQLPQAIYDAIVSLPATMNPLLTQIFGDGMGNTITDAMQGAIDWVTGTLQPFAMNIVNAITPAVTMIQGTIQTVMPIIGSIISGVMSFIGGVIDTVWPHIETIVMTVVNGIMALFQVAWPMIEQAVVTAMTMIDGILQQVWPAAQALIGAVMGAISGIIQTAWPIIQGIIETVMHVIQGIIETVWPIISGIIETAVGVIVSVIEGMTSLIDGVTSTFNQIKEAITGPIESAKETVDRVINDIIGFFTGLGERISNAIGPIVMPSLQGSATVNGEQMAYADITWQATGGILTNATLIGAGEAGAEAIIPLTNRKYTGAFASVIAEQIDVDGGEEILIRWLNNNLGAIIAANAPTISRRDFDRMARGAIA